MLCNFDRYTCNINVLWPNHIHVRCGEMEAVYQIPDGNLLEGSLPVNKEKLVKAWIEIHNEDLMANWQLAVSGNKVFTIDPLK